MIARAPYGVPFTVPKRGLSVPTEYPTQSPTHPPTESLRSPLATPPLIPPATLKGVARGPDGARRPLPVLAPDVRLPVAPSIHRHAATPRAKAGGRATPRGLKVLPGPGTMRGDWAPSFASDGRKFWVPLPHPGAGQVTP
jgi:hypothetical protein